MADRTLRRAYKGANRDTDSVSNGIGSDEGSESEQSIGVADTDTIVDRDSNGLESDTNGVSGIGTVTIDPEQLGDYISGSDGSGDSGEPRKRRGRKPGSKNGTGKKKAADSVEPFLIMAHQWAAVLLHTPEIALSEPEAKQLSDAYTNFCEYHDVPVLSPKRMSEINLIAACFVVYGPRFVAARNRMKESKKVKHAKNVTEFVSPVTI